jgi:hypothetical protein
MSAWLAAAYAALALGLAWSLARGTRWRSRALYAVVAPLVALGLWLGRPDPAGWPSKAHVPATASLVWAQVDEPDPAAADPGRIYLWVELGAGAPRAYSLPYSRPLHERVQHALNALRRGSSIAVARARSTHAAGTRGAAAAARSAPVRFYPHPPVALPPKTRDSP